MRRRDAQQKLRIKSKAESRRTIKDCDIQIGDTVLVRQPKREKLPTPYHPTPLTVTKKHHSMLTAESTDRRVTRNSSHFKAVIPKLDRTFAAYAVPQVVKSDNGPPFNGGEFAQFAKYLGFKHQKVSPLWPKANGEVERFMKTFGKVLRTTAHWKQDMYQFLRNYRATPHCTTGVAPATALFGRPISLKNARA